MIRLIGGLADARLVLMETPPLWKLPIDSIVRGGMGTDWSQGNGGEDPTLHLRDDASGGCGGVWPLLKLNLDEQEIRSSMKGTRHQALAEKAIKKRMF